MTANLANCSAPCSNRLFSSLIGYSSGFVEFSSSFSAALRGISLVVRACRILRIGIEHTDGIGREQYDRHKVTVTVFSMRVCTLGWGAALNALVNGYGRSRTCAGIVLSEQIGNYSLRRNILSLLFRCCFILALLRWRECFHQCNLSTGNYLFDQKFLRYAVM